MKGLVELSILFLGFCVLATSLPEFREMDRKDEYLRGCMEHQVPDRYPEYQKIVMCQNMWNRSSR